MGKRSAATMIVLLALAGCAAMSGSDRVPVRLSGAEEVPPVATAGTGSGSFAVASDGAVSGSVTTSGIEGTMAHIHLAGRGQNGPVIVPLVKNGNTYSTPPGARLTDAQMKAFKAGDLYVNVHTNAHKGGEIRAQLTP